ncbi:MAG: InlB B-repeat-containing protein [Bacillota bacterium]|nr:InlB B-repeat-containing protein [Bacillota bacterium]
MMRSTFKKATACFLVLALLGSYLSFGAGIKVKALENPVTDVSAGSGEENLPAESLDLPASETEEPEEPENDDSLDTSPADSELQDPTEPEESTEPPVSELQEDAVDVNVSFDTDGGDWNLEAGEQTLSLMSGDTFTLPGLNAATKDGFSLCGWMDIYGTSYPLDAQLEVNEDMLFTALWEESSEPSVPEEELSEPLAEAPVDTDITDPVSSSDAAYAPQRMTGMQQYPDNANVVFETLGGTWVQACFDPSGMYSPGDKLFLPPRSQLSLAGYALTGWSDASGDVYEPGAEFIVNEDNTFTAIWSEGVAVSFDTQGGQWDPGWGYGDEVEYILPGERYGLPGRYTITKEGYILDVWIDASGQDYLPGDEAVVNEDTVFTAVWAEPVTISFDPNGGTWTHGDRTAVLPTGSPMWLPGPQDITNEGYALAAWRDTVNNVDYPPDERFIANQDMSFTAVWAEAVTVTFVPEGGEWTYGDRSTVHPRGSTLVLPNDFEISKDHFALVGWLDTASYNNYLPGDEIHVNTDMTFIAVWADAVTIHFELGAGRWISHPQTAVARGSYYILPWKGSVANEPYVLSGWRDAWGSEFMPGTRIEVYGDMTLTAIWAEAVTVTYDLDGGQWNPRHGDLPTACVSGELILLPDHDSAIKEGFVLGGWKDAADKRYKPGERFTVYGNATFTAIWQDPVTVSYDAAGGSWSPNCGQDDHLLPETWHRLPDRYAISKADAALAGWQDSSGKAYQPGEWIRVKQDMTLTANWVDFANITFDRAGGEWSPDYIDRAVNWPKGSSYALPGQEMIIKNWYLLGAWQDESGTNYQPGEWVVVNESTTFTAVWLEPVTASFDPLFGVWGPDYGEPVTDLPGTQCWLPSQYMVYKEGYKLSGWKDTANKVYQPGEMITLNNDETYTAIWTEPVMVEYDLNDGNWAWYGGEPSESVAPGEWYQLPDWDAVSKEGYALGAWMDADGIEYPPGHRLVVNENMLFTALWTDQVSVSYNGAGGEWKLGFGEEPEYMAPGALCRLRDNAYISREGYALAAWKDGDNNEYLPGLYTPVNGDTVFTAVWVEPVTVTFNPVGGAWQELAGDQIRYVAPGETLRLPSRYTVSKEGYVLKGWMDAANREYQDGTSIVVIEDMTLTAIWAEPLIVTLHTGGGEWAPYHGHHSEPEMDLTAGSIYALPGAEAVVRNGYVLYGWKDSSGRVYEAGEWVVLTENMDFVAVWGEAVQITFATGGGQWTYFYDSDPFAAYTVTWPRGQACPLPGDYAVIRDGYVLSGWKDASGTVHDPEMEIVAERNMVFTAVWSDPVSITLDPAGGQWRYYVPPVIFCARGSDYYLPGRNVLLNSQFALSGWRDAANNVHAPGAKVTVTENMSFTAVWAGPVRITLDPSGGTWAYSDANPISFIWSLGSPYTLPSDEAAVKEGCQLIGWLDQMGEVHAPETELVVTEDMYFTAFWMEPERVHISLDPAGGIWTEGEAAGESTPVLENLARGSLYHFPDQEAVQKDGYLLDGWLDELGGARYAPGAEIIVTEDMNFTAIWQELVTITLDPAGGRWLAGEAYGQSTPVQVTVPKDSLYSLPALGTVYYEMHYLTGWLDEAGMVHEPNEKIVVAEAMNVTAVWQEEVIITLDPGTGFWTAGDLAGMSEIIQEIVDKDSSYTLPDWEAVQKEGYLFDGWLDEAEQKHEPGTQVVVTEDKVFVAQWIEMFDISLDPAGGVWTFGEHIGESAPIQASLPDGSPCYLPDSNLVIREGYQLCGWMDEAGIVHAPGIEFILTESKYFTAVWQEMVIITLDPAGGIWNFPDSASESAPISYELLKGSEYQLPGWNNVYKHGHLLNGWMDEAGVIHEPGSTLVVNESVTLTAAWVLDPLRIVEFMPPAGVELDMGVEIHLSVRAEGGIGPYSYQFYILYLDGSRNCFTEDPVFRESFPWIPEAAGDYTLGVDVYDVTGQLATQTTVVRVNPPPLVIAEFRTGGSDVYELGQRIHLSAWGEGGIEPYEYQFYVLYPDNSRENFTETPVPANSHEWIPDAPGDYTLGVDVYDMTGQMATAESQVMVRPPHIPPLFIVNFSTGGLDICEPGQTINLSVLVEGGIKPYEYQFYVLHPDNSRENLTETPVPANTHEWTPDAPGDYTLGVDVYDVTGQMETRTTLVRVNPPPVPPLKIAVFRAGWSETYELGQTINLAARGEGGTAPYKYQFYVLRSNGSRVNFRKDPVSANIYPWTPVTPDTYTLGVDVHDATGRMVTETKTITVKAPEVPPLTIAVFRAGWSDTYELGQTIDLAARGEGGTAPYKYQFYVLRSNGSRVNFRKDPVSANIYPWTPVTPDTYTLGVDVYDATGRMVTQTKTITVTAPDAPPLTIAVFRAGWSDTYTLGQTVNLAARGEGGTGPYKYQFFVLRSNGARVNFRKDPVSANIYPWTPVTPDTYTLGVDVYDATGRKVTETKIIKVLPKP